MNAELNRLDSSIAELQARASGLGSALATLQGCQAVLGSSKASRLSPGSRLAVLQLVLSDVAARLPYEQLQELEVLEGLPSSDSEAREICALAGAGSIQAAVQPLLQAGIGPAQVTPQAVSAAPGSSFSPVHAAGVQMSGMQSDVPTGQRREGSMISTASMSTATTSRFRGSRYSYSSRPPAPPPPSHSSQQYAPWYADLRQHDDDDDDSDDDIMDSLSSVLSSRHYTPRPSLSYESRKAAAAAALQAAANHQARNVRRPPAGAAAPTVASGSAAAAGAAALTLAGIAGSGSWVQSPQEEVDDGFGSGQHAGTWDTVNMHSPGSVSSSQRHKWHQPPQPLSPTGSAASSRRGSSRGGFGYGPSGLPFPLPSCPESPTSAAGQGPGAYSAGSALGSVPAGLANLSVSMHSIEQQLLQAQGFAGTAHFSPQQFAAVQAVCTQPQAVPVQRAEPEQVVHSQPVPVPAQAAPVEPQDGCSRSSSFESCVSARSRFSMEVQQTAPAGPDVLAQTHSRPAGAHAPPAGAHMVAGRHVAAAGNSAQGLDAGQLLSSALPAGIDVQNITVGELLRVLTAAVTQQQSLSNAPGS